MCQPVKPAKRKAEDEPQDGSEIDTDDERCHYVDISCNAVRSKITYINSGEMKVGEFHKAIGANENCYRRLMGQTGPGKGSGSMVYVNAFAFFKKRESKGKKIPKKVKKEQEEEEKKHDMSGIHLDGESDGDIPVYDTCDEVRKKIRAHLAMPSVTQAGFLRAIADTHPEGKKFSSTSLSNFMGKRGANAGNTCGTFYSAHIFFEKMRIKERKPKSKHREEMEEMYGNRGFDIETPSHHGYICVGTQPYIDNYGVVRVL